MIDQIFPRPIDNTYRGHRLALWLLAPILVLKTAIALASIFDGGGAAQRGDGVALDSFGADGAQAFVTLLALLGVCHLIFNLLGFLTLARYRAMVPLLFIVLTLEHLARKSILWAMPIARTGQAPGFYVNLVLLALMFVGLALSLQRRSGLQVQQ